MIGEEDCEGGAAGVVVQAMVVGAPADGPEALRQGRRRRKSRQGRRAQRNRRVGGDQQQRWAAGGREEHEGGRRRRLEEDADHEGYEGGESAEAPEQQRGDELVGRRVGGATRG